MKKTVVLRLLIALLLVSQVGCSAVIEAAKEASQKDDPKKEQTLVSSHKRLQITVPSSWKQDDDLHENDELGASNRIKELYIILLDESKQDFEEMTLEKHSETTLSTMKEAVKSPQVSEGKNITINGMPALQYELKGSVDGTNVVFLHTTVETSESFCQVLAWTLASKWDTNEKILQDVIGSLKEVDGSAPTPAATP